MSLVPSLLQAIVSVDGEALVLHAGDKPYVVAPSGQVELASKGLTLEAVNGIVAQLLPPEAFSALDEFGAIQHELAAQAAFAGESFTVVAARGGDDVWVEIRRRKIPDDDRVPEDFFAGSSGAPVVATAVDDSVPDLELHGAAPAAVIEPSLQQIAAPESPVSDPLFAAFADAMTPVAADDDLSLSLPDAGQLFGAGPTPETEPEPIVAAPVMKAPPAPVAPPLMAAPVAPPTVAPPVLAQPVAPLPAPPPLMTGPVAVPPPIAAPQFVAPPAYPFESDCARAAAPRSVAAAAREISPQPAA